MYDRKSKTDAKNYWLYNVCPLYSWPLVILCFYYYGALFIPAIINRPHKSGRINDVKELKELFKSWRNWLTEFLVEPQNKVAVRNNEMAVRRSFTLLLIYTPSWLVRSTPEQALRVRALAGDIVLCS